MNTKLNLILSCAFFLIWNSDFAQQNFKQTFTFQAIYRMSYRPDSNNLKNLANEDMELLANDSLSLFRSINFGIIDSASYLHYQKQDMAAVMKVVSAYRTSFRYCIVKNPVNMIYTDEILSSRIIA